MAYDTISTQKFSWGCFQDRKLTVNIASLVAELPDFFDDRVYLADLYRVIGLQCRIQSTVVPVQIFGCHFNSLECNAGLSHLFFDVSVFAIGEFGFALHKLLLQLTLRTTLLCLGRLH